MKRYIYGEKGQCYGCKYNNNCGSILSYGFNRSRLVDVCYKYSKDMHKFTYKVESCAQEEI